MKPQLAPEPSTGTRRAAQRDQTRTRLLQVAVTALIERGAAGVTTLEVQERADVSRGALLHHFPTRAELLSATVTELVRRNEAALWREQAEVSPDCDALRAAIRALAAAASTPSYGAELELWAVARTDAALRKTLRSAERDAMVERERVLARLFACIDGQPGRDAVVALSVEFARGLALSNLLRKDNQWKDAMVEAWADAATTIIERKTDLGGSGE